MLFRSNDDGKVGVHFTLDFVDNVETSDPQTLEDLILKKAGRRIINDKLFILIRDFLVYVKNFDIWIEKILVTEEIKYPVRPLRK